jgi:hypothetical protein
MRRSAEDFVRAWQTSSSIAEVARAVGGNEKSIQSRASRLRKRGVPLKYMHNGGCVKPLDVAALATLAKELEATNG